MGYYLATSNLQVSNWWVNLPASLSWRYLCPASLQPAFKYAPKILTEKHPKRENDIPHAKSCMIFHTSLTAWPQGCSQSWRLGTCPRHPSLRGVLDEHKTHPLRSWEAKQLSTACSSSSGFLRVFPGSFGGSADLNHVTVRLSTGTATCSAATPPPPPFCHVNVNMNHQDRSKSIKWLGFLPQQWHLEHYSSQQSWVWGLAGACQRIRITCEEPHRKTCGKGQPINKTVPKYEGVWAWLTAHTSSLGCFQRPRPLTVSLPWATTAHWGSLTGALATLGCSCSTL